MLGEETAKEQAIADLALLDFFFLLRPGKYCKGGTDTLSAPFRLCDVTFFCGEHCFPASTSTAGSAASRTLLPSAWKNGVNFESMGHSHLFDDVFDPVTIIDRCVTYLLANGAHGGTPLCAYRQGTLWRYICSTDITAALRATAKFCGHSLGILPSKISTRKKRADGAMALLLAGIGGKCINILGRWRSDVMMRYLHMSAPPVLSGFAARMVHHKD